MESSKGIKFTKFEYFQRITIKEKQKRYNARDQLVFEHAGYC